MKRKSLATIIICLISAMLLTGCGAASDSNLKDKLENVKEAAEEEEENSADEEKPEKKKLIQW